MDSGWARTFPDEISTNQGSGLLARAVAEPGSDLQQFAGQLFDRIARGLSNRCGELGVVRGIDPTSNQKEEVNLTILALAHSL